MKMIKLIAFSLILFSLNIYAQNNRYGGVIRNEGFGNTGYSKPNAKQVEKEKTEILEKFMKKMNKELLLDELQYIAIKNEIVSNNKNMEIIIKSENSENDKTIELKALQEKTEKNILSYLNATQKEKFKVLIEKN